jgi:hypothetical protein
MTRFRIAILGLGAALLPLAAWAAEAAKASCCCGLCCG